MAVPVFQEILGVCTFIQKRHTVMVNRLNLTHFFSSVYKVYVLFMLSFFFNVFQINDSACLFFHKEDDPTINKHVK